MFLTLTDPDSEVTILVPSHGGESIYVQEPVDYILKQLEVLK